VRGLWLQAELVAMATDLAEIVGAAVGLNLLFGIPLAAAGLTAALAAFNLAMLIVAAVVFRGSGPGPASITRLHAGLADLVGGGAALAFAVALLASGISSSGVGTLAGQVIMDGFLARRGSVLVRRVITVAPALAVLAAGVSPTRVLVFSQVILSFGIPFALIPLALVTRSRRIMGPFAAGRWTTSALWLITAAVSVLNVILVWQQLISL
jgi:manganese transport protein